MKDIHKTLANALKLLSFFKGNGAELGVRELARMTSLPLTTVQRFLNTFCEYNILQFNPITSKYSIGIEVLSLARSVMQAYDLATASLDVMKALRDAINETVCLHVYRGGARLTIQQVESSEEIRWMAEIGRPYPIHVGASGKCLLAHLPYSIQEEILQRLVNSGELPVNIEVLRSELEIIRTQGWAITRGERAPGGVGIAAPVFLSNAPPACLSIYAPEFRMDQERQNKVLRQLLQSAEHLSEKLSLNKYNYSY